MRLSSVRNVVLMGSAVITMAGCKADVVASIPTGPQANVRMIYASPNGPLSSLVYNGTTLMSGLQLTVAAPVTPTSGYVGIPTGSTNFAILQSGGTSLGAATATVASGGNYTLITTGRVSGTGARAFALNVLNDTTARPATGGWLRMYNAADSVNAGGPVDVYVYVTGTASPATPTVAGLAFKAATAYTPYTGGATTATSYTVNVVPAGSTNIAANRVASATVTLLDGQVKSLYFLSPSATITGTVSRIVTIAEQG